jgi:hypothetical protein
MLADEDAQAVWQKVLLPPFISGLNNPAAQSMKEEGHVSSFHHGTRANTVVDTQGPPQGSSWTYDFDKRRLFDLTYDR